MTYSIGEISKLTGISPSTLRFYDKEGLLPQVKRTQGGIRVFSDADVSYIHLIECLKKTNMPLKEIKQFIDWSVEGDSTITQRLNLINRQRDAVLQQIAALKETLNTLDYKQWYYETAKNAGTCAVHNSLTQADVPERFRSN